MPDMSSPAKVQLNQTDEETVVNCLACGQFRMGEDATAKLGVML
jgi:hypothetical protein